MVVTSGPASWMPRPETGGRLLKSSNDWGEAIMASRGFGAGAQLGKRDPGLNVVGWWRPALPLYLNALILYSLQQSMGIASILAIGFMMIIRWARSTCPSGPGGGGHGQLARLRSWACSSGWRC
jgi:hypothetical protein